MEFIAIKKWADDYNGAGIYCLTDENGKKYIKAIYLKNHPEEA